MRDFTGYRDTFSESGSLMNTASAVASGRWDQIRKTDAAEVAEMVMNFIPGAAPFFAGSGISAINTEWREADTIRKLEYALGLKNLRLLAKDSLGIQQGLKELDDQSANSFEQNTVSGAAAMIGMLGANLILPGVSSLAGLLVGAAGSIGGATAASALYDKFMGTQSEDTLALTAQVRLAQLEARSEAQKTGKPYYADVPREVVFAMLVLNLPESERKIIMRDSHIENFSELVANNDLKKLKTAMTSELARDLIENNYASVLKENGIQLDPTLSVKEYFDTMTKIINSGAIDANEFSVGKLLRSQLRAAKEAQMLQQQGVISGGNIDEISSGLERPDRSNNRSPSP